jgi:hypothetical protein
VSYIAKTLLLHLGRIILPQDIGYIRDPDFQRAIVNLAVVQPVHHLRHGLRNAD